jgi:hypothetical protein
MKDAGTMPAEIVEGRGRLEGPEAQPGHRLVDNRSHRGDVERAVIVAAGDDAFQDHGAE